MQGRNLPPKKRIPSRNGPTTELIDQYRYIRGELADEDSEYLNSDESTIVAIEEELKRRGLNVVSDDVQPDPGSAGREAEGPATSPP